ncbi:predicted protein [Naegleria gruberi]|uniref:Predicted protein n=1 Tax=Naegleria gruberi TaxID=5762 RepID=D2V296_NAEGR|nr:uncharacterized protein NAEGRDRAFT_62924 [Naegleria gruberi]EFC49018.1 predicted protein [Naegleria gruberi]|eukprot:XP_002681762.1 predicted protein [Naegleria gruberi strain NEG-M]
MDILRAKLFPKHAAMLLRDQVLRTDKEWNVLSHSNGQPAAFLFTLMNPDNYLAAKYQNRILTQDELDKSYVETTKSLLNERDDIYSNLDDWFKRELSDLDSNKEDLEEYFSYFKQHDTISMLKVHENIYERWSQFSFIENPEQPQKPTITSQNKDRSHFVLNVKVLDEDYAKEHPTKPPRYIPGGTIAFSVKTQYIDGKEYKVGLAGSGWCNKKYRDHGADVKFSAWYMKILLMYQLGIRYCYAHVFADNAKSLSYISKSGMVPSRFRLKFLGFNTNISGKDEVRNKELIRTQKQINEVEESNAASDQSAQLVSLEEYKTLMERVYGKANFLITQLEKLYYHPNFAGCFVDPQNQVTFQLWRAKYSVDQKTKAQMPAFVVYNTSHTTNCNKKLTESQCESIINSLTQKILPQMCGNVDTKLVNLVFATHGGSMYKYLLKRYSDLDSISYASLYYTLQDNMKFIKKVNPETDPVARFLLLPPQPSSNPDEEEHNLFLDVRDCTGKPMIWSNQIRDTEMECLNEDKGVFKVIETPNAPFKTSKL